MNTFFKAIVLIAIIVCYYLLLCKMNKDKNKERAKKDDLKDVIYYVLPIIAIIVVMHFTFTTYIPFSWNKIVVLAMILAALLLVYFVSYLTAEGYKAICVPIITIIAIVVFATYFPITGKQQFEEPIEEVNSYSIVISTNEENEFAVKKVIENNNEYYLFTYLDKNQKPVYVETTADKFDIIVDDKEENLSTCQVKEKLFIYQHTEITDNGENFTFEDEVEYTVYVSKDLFYDTTV